MTQQINYKEIMDLGFTEEPQVDNNYFNRHGYGYSIITKSLTKTIYLDWEKDTKLCNLIRMDNPEDCNIKARLQIRDKSHLLEIIKFFDDEYKENKEFKHIDYTKYA